MQQGVCLSNSLVCSCYNETIRFLSEAFIIGMEIATCVCRLSLPSKAYAFNSVNSACLQQFIFKWKSILVKRNNDMMSFNAG